MSIITEVIARETPEAFDTAMSRATMAPDAWVELAQRLVPIGGRIFVLTLPTVPISRANLTARADRVYLDGRRRLVELERLA